MSKQEHEQKRRLYPDGPVLRYGGQALVIGINVFEDGEVGSLQLAIAKSLCVAITPERVCAAIVQEVKVVRHLRNVGRAGIPIRPLQPVANGSECEVLPAKKCVRGLFNETC